MSCKFEGVGEVLELLKAIKEKLDEIDEKIENFMGFFDLSEEELEIIEKDLEACEKGNSISSI